MANNHKSAEKPGLMLHYFHACFWVTLVLAGIVTAALSAWSLQLTPFAEIVLLAVWLVAPVPLAIRARQRDANRQSDPNAVEHLLSALFGQMLVMLFDLAIFATAAIACVAFAILLWKVIKYFVGKVI